MTFSLLGVLFNCLKYPIYFVLCFFVVFFFSVCVNIVIQLAKGKRFPKNEGTPVKKKGFFWRIFIDTPHQFVIDLFNREADFFPYQV